MLFSSLLVVYDAPPMSSLPSSSSQCAVCEMSVTKIPIIDIRRFRVNRYRRNVVENIALES